MNNLRVKLYTTLRRVKADIYKKYFPRLYLENLSRWERISHDYKCIFIHIPKTGGNSITTALNKLPKRSNTPISISTIPKHAKAQRVKQALGDDIWEAYFSFAFVRNPWDLMVSSYHWWLQTAPIWKHLHAEIKEIEKLGSFDHFMHSKYGQEMINESKGTMFDWISENDEVIVDFVGRFENIQEDWEKICVHLGSEPTTMPHINKTRRRNYQQYYTPETRQIVYERFQKVIDLYGYEF